MRFYKDRKTSAPNARTPFPFRGLQLYNGALSQAFETVTHGPPRWGTSQAWTEGWIGWLG